MILPLALIGLVSLPVIVAFYMLRLRRRDYPVGSTFLWQQLIRDVEANAPWQRLRFSWLLLVQLLIATLIVLAAARPFSATTSDLAANVVLIVDTSASMATHTDGEDRMALARERAADVVGRLPEGGRVTVVAAADTANVLVSETDDRDAALEAIDGITATQLPGDLTDAFALASALAARDSDSTIVVVSDASDDELPEVGVGAPVLVERVGETDANQSVAALSALRRSGGAQLDVFVAVANPSTVEATRRLEIYADGALVDARELTIPPGQRSEALVSTVPPSRGDDRGSTRRFRCARDGRSGVRDRAGPGTHARPPRRRGQRVPRERDGPPPPPRALRRRRRRLCGRARRGGGGRDALRALRLRRPRARRAAARCRAVHRPARRTASSARSRAGSRGRSSIAPIRTSRSCASST